MIKEITVFLSALIMVGCASLERLVGLMKPSRDITEPITTANATSTALTVDQYKKDLAQRIVQVNSDKVYITRPQALLRSVVVIKYIVDGNGNLISSEIIRTNRDKQNDTTALTSLKNSAPFPKPGSHLLNYGQLELSESWLFNNDGRFQLRSIALPQINR